MGIVAGDLRQRRRTRTLKMMTMMMDPFFLSFFATRDWLDHGMLQLLFSRPFPFSLSTVLLFLFLFSFLLLCEVLQTPDHVLVLVLFHLFLRLVCMRAQCCP